MRSSILYLLVGIGVFVGASCITSCKSDKKGENQEMQDAYTTVDKDKTKPKKKRKKKKQHELQAPSEIVVPAKKPTEIKVPDTYPLYPGCTQKNYQDRKACAQSKLSTMLHQVMKYPDMNKEENKPGIVRYSFIIKEDGTMSDLKLEDSLSPECDEAAEKAIKELFNKSGPWEPATIDGEKVAA